MAARRANPVVLVLVRGAETATGRELTALASMMAPRTAPRWTEEALGGTIVSGSASPPLLVSRLMRIVELRPPVDARGRELLILAMFAEASGRLGLPPSRCAEEWPAVAAQHGSSREASWDSIRAHVFERLMKGALTRRPIRTQRLQTQEGA